MSLIYSLIALSLISLNAFAAVWERPSGAYTPTNHSINTSKYQVDSANNTPISSVKVDGDINKAFQGLNDIEARTPPSVLGKSGLFLSNNGVAAEWTAIDRSTLISGTTQVTANTSTISLTVGGFTSHFNSGGLVVDGISASTVTATTLNGNLITGTISATGYITTTAGVSAEVVSATAVNARYVSATEMTVGSRPLTSQLVPIGTVVISTTASGCVVTASSTTGVGTSCSRLAQGNYAISGTFPNASFKPMCSFQYSSIGNGPIVTNGTGGAGYQNRIDGFFIGSAVIGPTAAFFDNVRIGCVVYP